MNMQFEADWSEFRTSFVTRASLHQLISILTRHTMVPGTTFQVYAIIPALGAIMAILWPKTPVLADEENPWTQDQSLSRTVLGEEISQHHHLNQPMMIQNLSILVSRFADMIDFWCVFVCVIVRCSCLTFQLLWSALGMCQGCSKELPQVQFADHSSWIPCLFIFIIMYPLSFVCLFVCLFVCELVC